MILVMCEMNVWWMKLSVFGCQLMMVWRGMSQGWICVGLFSGVSLPFF